MENNLKLNELLTKYGGEVIQRPAIDNASKFEYRGYNATFTLNGKVYEITYDPVIARNIERLYSRCKTESQCKEFATKAIDLAHAAQVQASGQAAQAGETGTTINSGPLVRNNG